MALLVVAVLRAAPNTYTPVFSGGDLNFFDPMLGSEFGRGYINPQLEDLQRQIEELRGEPAFDPSGINERIAGLEGRISAAQPFDPTNLQQQIAELRGREAFDPTALAERIAGLEGRVSGISEFDPSGLQAQILANQERIGGISAFDPSGINERIAGLEGRLSG